MAIALTSTPNRLRRLACMTYEGILLCAVVFVAGYVFDALTQSRHELMLRHARQAWIFMVMGMYFVWCWYHSGQTLAMKTWRITLCDQAGHRPTLFRLMVRYFLVWPVVLLCAGLISAISSLTQWPAAKLLILAAPFSIFIWSWFDPEGQFLHDRLLGTRLRNTVTYTG